MHSFLKSICPCIQMFAFVKTRFVLSLYQVINLYQSIAYGCPRSKNGNNLPSVLHLMYSRTSREARNFSNTYPKNR